MTKKVILTFGIYGVGKTYNSLKYIEQHPEFELLGCYPDFDTNVSNILQHEHVIMDYYFANDYNANRLKQTLGCEVEIFVLFDDPAAIVMRQINSKDNHPLVRKDAWNILITYHSMIRQLIYLPECRFFNSLDFSEVSYDEYLYIVKSYYSPTPKKEIEKILALAKLKSSEFDYKYQHVKFPFGLSVGDKNLTQNVQTWELLRPMYDWTNKSALDLCCFVGYFSQQIWLNGGNPVGVDVHKHALFFAAMYSKINYMDFPLYNYDICKFCLPGHFDVALLLNCFHHLADQNFVLHNLQKYETVFFEINETDLSKIEKYFKIETNIPTPRGRILLKGAPKGEAQL